MTDDYKRGLVTGLAMQPLAVINTEAPINNPLIDYEYISDLSAKCNGVTYTAEKDSETGMISRISDDAGNKFEPTINSGITDTTFHNAVFMAIAICRGFGKTPDCIPVYNYAGVKGFNPEYSTYVGLTSGSNSDSYPIISDDVIVLNHWCSSNFHYNHLFALTAGVPNKAYSKLRLDIETTMAHSTWNHCLITVATGMDPDNLKPNTDNGLTDIIVKKYLTCWSASFDPAPNISLPRSIVEIDISQSIGKNVYVTFRHNCCDVKIYSIALIK